MMELEPAIVALASPLLSKGGTRKLGAGWRRAERERERERGEEGEKGEERERNKTKQNKEKNRDSAGDIHVIHIRGMKQDSDSDPERNTQVSLRETVRAKVKASGRCRSNFRFPVLVATFLRLLPPIFALIVAILHVRFFFKRSHRHISIFFLGPFVSLSLQQSPLERSHLHYGFLLSVVAVVLERSERDCSKDRSSRAGSIWVERRGEAIVQR
jgi:hypothetical protein